MLILRVKWNKHLLRDIWVAWWGDTSYRHWVHVCFNIHLQRPRMNRLCGNPDNCFGLVRIFLFFLILSHTHHFLLNSPNTQALNHFTSFTPSQNISNLGVRFLGRSSGSGLIIETSISYHTSIYHMMIFFEPWNEIISDWDMHGNQNLKYQHLKYMIWINIFRNQHLKLIYLKTEFWQLMIRNHRCWIRISKNKMQALHRKTR